MKYGYFKTLIAIPVLHCELDKVQHVRRKLVPTHLEHDIETLLQERRV